MNNQTSHDSSDEMDPKTYSQICDLLDEGDVYLEKDEYECALETFERALALIPRPINEWHISLNVWTAIGETFLFMKDYESAHDVLAGLMHDPGALGNPYIHLRLGQAYYELGNMRRATDELVRVYLLDGSSLFEGEDPKYLDVVRAANLRDIDI